MATLLLRFRDLGPEDVTAVEVALRALPGVYGAVVSASEGCAEVDFEDDEIGVDAVVDRLRGEGYAVTVSG